MAYKTRAGETQHQARERIARAKGFRSYREYRKAPPDVRETRTRALVRDDPEYAAAAPGAATIIRRRAVPPVVRTPAGTVVHTEDVGIMRAQVRGAARAGVERIHVYMKVRLENGEYRTIAFDVDAADAADAADFVDYLLAEANDALDSRYAGVHATGASVPTLRFG